MHDLDLHFSFGVQILLQSVVSRQRFFLKYICHGLVCTYSCFFKIFCVYCGGYKVTGHLDEGGFANKNACEQLCVSMAACSQWRCVSDKETSLICFVGLGIAMVTFPQTRSCHPCSSSSSQNL